MTHNIALILTPGETAFYYTHYCTIPLTLGILQGYLRSRGYTVSSTDLNTCMSQFVNPPEAEPWLPLYNKELVLKHLNTGTSTGMEDILDYFIQQTKAAQSDIIGISTGSNMSFFEIHMALLLGRRIQEQTGKTVVLGGANLDFLYQFRKAFQELWTAVLNNFKYIFIGPGERSFAELVDGLFESKGMHPYQELPGAVYFKEGQVHHNPEDSPTLVRPDFKGLNLNSCTFCCRASEPSSDSLETNLFHFFKLPVAYGTAISDMNRHILPEEDRMETLFIPYIFNYNCSYRCAFCVQSREDKPPVVVKDAASVVSDIKALISEHNTEFVRFFNNAFNLSPSFVREFCHLVIESGLRFYWSDCARFNNLTEDMVDLLYRAGCRKLVFGLDTASNKILKLIDKRLDLEQARQVLRWCHERGIWAELEVIVGLPWENEEDFQATYDFVQENIEKGYVTSFHLNRYFIIPCSRLGRQPSHYGIQIHQSAHAYKEMLQSNADTLVAVLTPGKGGGFLAHPCQIWNYSEITGRTAEQIARETDLKFSRMFDIMPRPSIFMKGGENIGYKTGGSFLSKIIGR